MQSQFENKKIMNEQLKGGIIVFLGAASFGLLSTIVKNAYGEGYDVGHITSSQSFFGMTILWILYFIQSRTISVKKNDPDSEQSEENSKPKTAYWKVMFAGTFTGLVGVFYYKCVTLIPASIAIILLMQYLWISIILDYIIYRKRPVKVQLIGAAFVLLGTVFAGGLFKESLDVDPVGIVYGMLAALCYAIFLLASGRVGTDLPVFKKSALMITGSCILTFIIFRPTFFWDGMLIDGLYKWGLILALLGTVIPPAFFSYGVPRTGIALGTILSAAELPVAVCSSFFVLHEDVDALQWLGVAIIFGTIMMTNIRFGRKRIKVES